MAYQNNNTFKEDISKHIVFITLILTVILHFVLFLMYMNNRGDSNKITFDVSNEKQAIQFIEQIKKDIHNMSKPKRDVILVQMREILMENQDSESPFMDDVRSTTTKNNLK